MARSSTEHQTLVTLLTASPCGMYPAPDVEANHCSRCVAVSLSPVRTRRGHPHAHLRP